MIAYGFFFRVIFGDFEEFIVLHFCCHRFCGFASGLGFIFCFSLFRFSPLKQRKLKNHHFKFCPEMLRSG